MGLIRRGIRYIAMRLKNGLRLRKTQLEWLKKNRHNKTRMGNFFPADRVSVGRYTYGELNVHHFDAEGEGLEIGDFCSIGPNVEFFLGGEHHPKFISNYPFGLYINGMEEYGRFDRTTKGKIKVDDDVWIGAHALIMSGVHIGQGAIIGAGTVVAKDVPPYAVYVNGKILRYRFNEAVIRKLLELDFSKIDESFLNLQSDKFYNEQVEALLTRFPVK